MPKGSISAALGGCGSYGERTPWVRGWANNSTQAGFGCWEANGAGGGRGLLLSEQPETRGHSREPCRAA